MLENTTLLYKSSINKTKKKIYMCTNIPSYVTSYTACVIWVVTSIQNSKHFSKEFYLTRSLSSVVKIFLFFRGPFVLSLPSRILFLFSSFLLLTRVTYIKTFTEDSTDSFSLPGKRQKVNPKQWTFKENVLTTIK